MATVHIRNDYDRDLRRVWLTFAGTKAGTIFNDLGPLAAGETTRVLEVPAPAKFPGLPQLPTMGSVTFELANGEVMSVHVQDGLFGLRASESEILIHGQDQRIELHAAGRNPEGREIKQIA